MGKGCSLSGQGNERLRTQVFNSSSRRSLISLQIPRLKVAGSNPVSRSKEFKDLARYG